jgi:hypothetical protein
MDNLPTSAKLLHLLSSLSSAFNIAWRMMSVGNIVGGLQRWNVLVSLNMRILSKRLKQLRGMKFALSLKNFSTNAVTLHPGHEIARVLAGV